MTTCVHRFVALSLVVALSAVPQRADAQVLSNAFLRVTFGARGISSLTDLASAQTDRLVSDDAAIVIGTETLDTRRLDAPTKEVIEDGVVFHYVARTYRIDVRYALKPGWRFVSKQLAITALVARTGGVVVGSYFTAPTDPELGFIYEGGSYTSFNVLGATSTTLRGISPDGRYLSGTFDEARSFLNGFVFDRTNAALVKFGAGTIVQGMSSHGVLVGSFFMGPRTPFTYDITTGIRTAYGPENDRYRDINDDGLIAGFRTGTAFVGRPGNFQNLAVAGAISTFAEGINNAGWVVGGYTDATGMVDHAFVARPVPEPGSWALLLGGLAAIGVSTRRRSA